MKLALRPDLDVLELMEISLSEPAAGHTSWHMIFPEGVFYHPSYGKLDFREPFLAEIKRNFDDKVRKIRVSIDTLHKNEDAAGWIEQLQYRPGEGLYALIEWTVVGVDKVGNKLLRYFSPEFGPFVDEVSQKKFNHVLSAVTLTNFPFLKRLPEVMFALSEVPRNLTEDDFDELVKRLMAGTKKCERHNKAYSECGCSETELVFNPKNGPIDDESPKNDAEMAEPDDSDDKELATDDEEDSKKKKQKSKGDKLKKPAGNEGAPQPSMPRGAKPHINRGRQPDPTGEIGSMSDTETTQTLTLAEVQQAIEATVAPLQAKLAEAEARNTSLAERLVKAETTALSAEIDDEVRQLSTQRTFTATNGDGTETRTAKFGIPASVAETYKKLALTSPLTRKPMFELLAQLQETGLVALTDTGSAVSREASTRTNDGDITRELNHGEYDNSLLVKAEEYCRKNSLNFSDVNDRTRACLEVLSAQKASR